MSVVAGDAVAGGLILDVQPGVVFGVVIAENAEETNRS